MLKTARGFTLVELLVSISIIAILAAIGFAVYTQAQKVARDGRRKADLEEIKKATDQYYLTSGANVYPADQAALNSAAGISSATYFAKGSIPTDPVDQSVYTYVKCGSAPRFAVCDNLETTTGNLAAMPTAANICNAFSETTSGTIFCIAGAQ